jgi:lysophospholipase L1-like esterase
MSDPVDLAVKPLHSAAVSFICRRRRGRSLGCGAQTTYVSGTGDKTKDADFKPESTGKSRLFLSRILTTAKPDSNAIVFFGGSITDGACSTVDTNNRWPDHIAERLQAEDPDMAVVKEDYSGDRVLTNGVGTNALSRFDMSVLSHPCVSTVVMMVGINDIGWPGKDAITATDPEPTAEDVIASTSRSSSARPITAFASWAPPLPRPSTRSRACRHPATIRPRRRRSVKP